MAKPVEAKTIVIDKLKETFGENYLGSLDGKKEFVKVKTKDGMITVALALTIPKDQGLAAVPESADEETPTPKKTQTEITQAEHDIISNLMAQLGI